MAREYKRRRKSHGGKKRGPKKGYRHSRQHNARISAGLERAWRAGKFKHRRRRRHGLRRTSSTRKRVEKPRKRRVRGA